MIILILLSMIIISRVKFINKNLKIVLIIGMLLLINIVSFAYGTDYLSYQYLYNGFKSVSSASSSHIEYGFKVLFSLFKALEINYSLFAIIFRTFLIGITSLWLYDSSDDIVLSLIVYFALFYTVWIMSAYRQGLVLAVGSYIVFNKKKNYSLITQLIVISILSVFHISALFYFVILILNKIKWTKKRQVIALFISLVFTFLPLYKIAELLIFIPGIDKVANYLSTNIGFFDTGSLMRLFFYLVTIFKYDAITTTAFNKKIVDSFLYGISLYFILKFSEITAGRLTIFTFILLVLIIPILAREYYTPKIRNLSYVTVYLICFVLLAKDFSAYKSQVNYKGDLSTFSIPTVFDKNYYDFDNIYAYIEYRKDQSNKFINDVKSNYSKKEVEYNEDDSYIVIRDKNNKYGIMNQNGDWYMKPSQNHELLVYDGVYSLQKKEDLYWQPTFYNMDKTEDSQEKLESKVNEYLSETKVHTVNQTLFEGNVFDIIDFENFVPYPEHVEKEIMVKVEDDGFIYNVIYFQYYSHHMYIYLDENLQPLADTVFSQSSLYKNGFLTVQNMTGYVVFNRAGDVIWAEQK